jgi:hypothetical protein
MSRCVVWPLMFVASGCAAGISAEVRVALSRPAGLSMVRAPPPTKLVAVSRDGREGEAAVGAALVFGLGLAASSVVSGLPVGPAGLQVPVNITDPEGRNPADLLATAVGAGLEAQGYPPPQLVSGQRLRFEGKPSDLPVEVVSTTPYVLCVQLDRLAVDGDGALRAVKGSASLFAHRKLVAHLSCDVREKRRAEGAWLRLIRECAAELVAPFAEVPR